MITNQLNHTIRLSQKLFFLLSTLLLLNQTPSLTQTAEIDSIQALLPNLSGPPLVDAYNDLEYLREEEADSLHLVDVIALADSLNYPEGLVRAQYNMVSYCYWDYQYETASKLNENVINDADRLGVHDLYCEACILSSSIGIELLDFEKAHKYAFLSYEKAKAVKNESSEVIGLSALAWFFTEINHYDLGIEYANKTLDLAIELGDEQLRFDAIMALITLHKDQKRYDSAIEVYDIHIDNNDGTPNYSSALNRTNVEIKIARVYNALNQPKNTLIHTNRAQGLNRVIGTDPWFEALIRLEKAEAFQQLGNLDSMYQNIVLTDSISALHGLSDINDKIPELLATYYKLTGEGALQLEYLEKAQTLTSNQERDKALIAFLNSDYYLNTIINGNSKNTSTSKYIWIFSILGLIAVVLFPIWNRKKKNRTNQANIEALPVSSNDTNEHLDIELDSPVNLLGDQIPHPEITKKEPLVVNMNKLAEESASWSTFKIYFEQVNPGFLDKLSTTHPNLTKNDLRLCGFFKLELSAKEIAQMINVQPSSVTIAKYRLKKKLKINASEISEYLQGIA